MSILSNFTAFLFKWEGGISNDPDDPGGLTNRGVTLKTWLAYGMDLNRDGLIDEKDLLLLTQEDVVRIILKPHYWDHCQADRIDTQAIANMLVDWYWCSGALAIRKVQRLLGINCDGIVGPQTLNAINRYPDQQELFEGIRRERLEYLQRICEARPLNRKFLRGWTRRVNDISYP